MPDQSPEDRLRQLGLELPPPPAPLASYRPVKVSGRLIVTSGVLATRDGSVLKGRIGAELTVEEGKDAARSAALALLALLAQAAGGLGEIAEVVLLCGYVRSAPGFSQQPEVVDGASQLLQQVLGVAGEHARVALGVSELPREACLELQLTASRVQAAV